MRWTLAEVRECLRTVRALLAAESVDFGGTSGRLAFASKRPIWEAAIAATSFVSDEVVAQLCDALGLIGAPADCAGRIAEMTKLGVRNLYLMPVLTFAPPEQEIAAFREVVFPRLRDARLR